MMIWIDVIVRWLNGSTFRWMNGSALYLIVEWIVGYICWQFYDWIIYASMYIWM